MPAKAFVRDEGRHMHSQRMCIYTCTEDIYNLLQIDCRSRSIASYFGDQESKVCTGKSVGLGHLRVRLRGSGEGLGYIIP